MSVLTAVFDLDGTLLNTIDDLMNATNQALEEYGFPTHPVEKYYYFVGSGARNLVRRALPPDVESSAYEAVYARYSALYEQHWNVCTRPYPGIPELLGQLRDMGVRMPVVSNKIHARTCQVIDAYFPGVFDAVLGNRPDVPLKPDPAAVFEALELMGGSPADSFYLGDTSVDLETGKNAGIYTAGALWGFRPEEIVRCDADILCRTPADALAAAKRVYGIGR